MKIERKRNPKGAVLFTVVSVLAIMIIFMTCTLAMASAANKRARKSYSSSQSTYTARATIDSILATVKSDKNFAKALGDVAKTTGKSMPVAVEFSDNSMGTIDNVYIKNVGTKQIYDPEKGTWAECSLLEISADITIGGEKTTIKSNVLQDPPQPPGKGAGGAAFLTYGTVAPKGNHTSSWGGTYFGMGEWAIGNNGEAKNWRNMLKYNKFVDGLPGTDGSGTTTFISDGNYRTNIDYAYQNNCHVEAPMVVNGNFEVTTYLTVNYTYHAAGVNNPGIQIWGNYKNPSGRLYLRANKNVRDYLNSSTYTSKSKQERIYDTPYIYVDQTIIGDGASIILGIGDNTGATITRTSSIKRNHDDPNAKAEDVKMENGLNTPAGFPLNIFCGNLDLGSNNSGIFGDVYCMDADGKSTLGGTRDGLYTWATSVMDKGNAYSVNGGNFYTNGNLIIDMPTAFDGEVRVRGDLTINADTIIQGILVVGGKITVSDSTSNLKLLEVNGKTTTKSECGIYAAEATGNLFEGSGADLKFDGKKVGSIQDFKDDYNEDIYPKYAEREILMGSEWKVKGVDGHVIKTDMTKVAGVPRLNGATTTKITSSCILTGEVYDKAITIEAGDDDIYVLLQDVNFRSKSEKDADGKDVISNKSKVNIVENGTGRVYIMFGGKVDSNYDYDTDPDTNKLLKNVADWMEEFRLEESSPSEGAIADENIYDGGYKDIEKKYTIGGDGKKYDAGEEDHKTQLVITENSKLSGAWKSDTYTYAGTADNIIAGGNTIKDIKIVPPENGTLTIVLENFESDNYVRFLVDDTGTNAGTVNFFLKGDNSFSTCGGIVAQSFLDICKKAKDNNTRFNIIGHNAYKSQFVDPNDKDALVYTPPKINIYSEAKQGDKYPSLKFANGSIITGYVHAKDLNVDLPTVSENKALVNLIRYDGVDLNGTETPRIGVIGMLDVRGADAQNDWLMLYVDNTDTEDTTVVESADGKHTYAAVEYYAYVN